MKAQWEKLAQRFQGYSLRERLMVAGMLTVVVLAVCFTLMLEPALKQRRSMQAQIAELNQQTATIDAQLAAMTARLRDPDAELRTRIKSVQDEIGAIDGRLHTLERTLVQPTRMTALLEQMLKRNTRLQLIELRKLPVMALVEKPQGKESSAAGERSPVAGVYKHGVELTVQGSYADLYEYLRTLEKLPQQLFWGEVKLVTETYPRNRMTIVVYTLSLDKAWLTV